MKSANYIEIPWAIKISFVLEPVYKQLGLNLPENIFD